MIRCRKENMIRQTKKLTKEIIKTLKRKAWRLMSEYIRRRDSGICYTCGDRKPWKQQQAGHFVHSTGRENGFSSIDFEEDNINCQCSGCNNESWKKGKDARLVYDRKMIERFPGVDENGDYIAERFQRMRKEIWKPSIQNLEDLIINLKFKIGGLQ